MTDLMQDCDWRRKNPASVLWSGIFSGNKVFWSHSCKGKLNVGKFLPYEWARRLSGAFLVKGLKQQNGCQNTTAWWTRLLRKWTLHQSLYHKPWWSWPFCAPVHHPEPWVCRFGPVKSRASLGCAGHCYTSLLYRFHVYRGMVVNHAGNMIVQFRKKGHLFSNATIGGRKHRG